ncbi:tRNA 4-thiouridine(8) synthase ThiI [Candidatus Micrarchaeota archaeon]|jgi:thiamine biosynthesis protein ThiI|nr:tRNA 4-thiouridine(8) synthase ThiI [Candidatus Micrarchaeota archaeon]
MYDSVIIHYGEIALKGKNRSYFENTLIKNIKKKINGKIIKYRGYFEIKLPDDSNLEEIESALKTIFGIENFSFCYTTKTDVKEIEKKAFEVIKTNKGTFKVKTKRADKSFPIKSPEFNRQLGINLEKNGVKAEITDPDYYLYVDIQQEKTYLYTKKISGLGGLPIGVSGKCVCLFSGGIDSPVAAYQMMGRGCKMILVHFYRTPEVEQKILELFELLKIYDPDIILESINFKNIQNNVIMEVSSKYRLLIYRRFMFRLAYEIAKKYKANCLCTGENLGQVASQTMKNMFVASQPIISEINVFRPLIAMDKTEIIQLAKEINTFKISIQPYEECCSFMIPKHPETHAQLKDILEYEDNLDVEELVKETIQK